MASPTAVTADPLSLPTLEEALQCVDDMDQALIMLLPPGPDDHLAYQQLQQMGPQAGAQAGAAQCWWPSASAWWGVPQPSIPGRSLTLTHWPASCCPPVLPVWRAAEPYVQQFSSAATRLQGVLHRFKSQAQGESGGLQEVRLPQGSPPQAFAVLSHMAGVMAWRYLLRLVPTASNSRCHAHQPSPWSAGILCAGDQGPGAGACRQGMQGGRAGGAAICAIVPRTGASLRPGLRAAPACL